MNREGYVFLGFLICVFVTTMFVVWLVVHFLGGFILAWWVIYLIMFLTVAPDERIPYRLVWAILIGVPVVVGIIGFGVAGLKGGLGGGLPVLLPPAVWLADKLDTKIRKRRQSKE